MTNKDETGFTLIELMLAVAIMGIIAVTAVRLLSPIITYFQRSPARQQANLQARQCMETIERAIANGKVGTWNIQTVAPVASSSIQFQSVDDSSTTIAWSTTPMNSVHLLRVAKGQTTPTDTLLATNVTTLSFSADYRDPAMIYVTFQMTVPLDSSGAPGSFFTIMLANQAVHMLSS